MSNENHQIDVHPLLLETDQTHCYNAAGEEIPCDNSGQDAEANPGREISETRFEAQDGLVADRLTGLFWSRNAGLAEFPMAWAEAFDYITELNRASYLGITQWRLPYRRELYSLISHQRVNPTLRDEGTFSDVFSGYYWTASPCARLENQAWYIHLGGGRVYRGMKANSYMVWPVVSSQTKAPAQTNRFVSINDTLYDKLTKRMWLNQKIVQHIEWERTFGIVEELNRQRAGSYNDWRLPNIRELESLVDLNRHTPSLPPALLSENIAEGYWSSTTSVYEKRYAWVMYTRDGAIGVGYKPLADFGVWPVRYAQ